MTIKNKQCLFVLIQGFRICPNKVTFVFAFAQYLFQYDPVWFNKHK